MKSLKSKKIKRMRNIMALFLFMSILISSLGSSISVQARDYPRVYVEDDIWKDAVVGENVEFTYQIYPAYKNERMNITIYTLSGEVVLQDTKNFYNTYDTPFLCTLTWNTKGYEADDYKIVATMEFYTYFDWHVSPLLSTNRYITLYPKKQIIKSVAVQNNQKLIVKWKKDSQADGYQIQYCTDKKFKKGKKTVTVKKNKTTQRVISKLKKGKRYYVRVRSYTNGIYGEWSKAKRSAAIK